MTGIRSAMGHLTDLCARPVRVTMIDDAANRVICAIHKAERMGLEPEEAQLFYVGLAEVLIERREVARCVYKSLIKSLKGNDVRAKLVTLYAELLLDQARSIRDGRSLRYGTANCSISALRSTLTTVNVCVVEKNLTTAARKEIIAKIKVYFVECAKSGTLIPLEAAEAFKDAYRRTRTTDYAPFVDELATEYSDWLCLNGSRSHARRQIEDVLREFAPANRVKDVLDRLPFAA